MVSSPSVVHVKYHTCSHFIEETFAAACGVNYPSWLQRQLNNPFSVFVFPFTVSFRIDSRIPSALAFITWNGWAPSAKRITNIHDGRDLNWVQRDQENMKFENVIEVNRGQFLCVLTSKRRKSCNKHLLAKEINCQHQTDKSVCWPFCSLKILTSTNTTLSFMYSGTWNWCSNTRFSNMMRTFLPPS